MLPLTREGCSTSRRGNFTCGGLQGMESFVIELLIQSAKLVGVVSNAERSSDSTC